MALGRRSDERQEELFVPHDRLPRSEGHAFYRQLNRLLAEAGFDRFVERCCRPHYQPSGTPGRPSIPPGVYFRMLLVGYFEGIGSQRGIAWRCHDSLSLREFLGVPLTEDAPDHSSLTRVRDRLPLEVHAAAFQFVLEAGRREEAAQGQDGGRRLDDAGSQRRDEEHRPQGHGRGLAGVRRRPDAGARRHRARTPSRPTRRFAGSTRSGRTRRSPTRTGRARPIPDARIAKMKDGRTHLAYKAEHVGRPRQRADPGGRGLSRRPVRPAHAGRQRDGSASPSQRSGRRGDDRGGGGRQGVSRGRAAGAGRVA